MELILIRHGQSVANEKGLLISTRLDGLTEKGISQTKSIKHIVNKYNLQDIIVYCSPWNRAKETANILFPNGNIIFDERLAETNPGIYGKWKEEDFYKKFPNFSEDINNKYEEGESHYEMAVRVISFIDELLKEKDIYKDKTVFIVYHGGPISVTLQYLLNIDIKLLYPTFTVPNASLSVLKWRKDLLRFVVEKVGYN